MTLDFEHLKGGSEVLLKWHYGVYTDILLLLRGGMNAFLHQGGEVSEH